MPMAPSSRLPSSRSRISAISDVLARRSSSNPIADMRSIEWPMRKALLTAGFASVTSEANSANVPVRCSFFFTISDIRPTGMSRVHGDGEAPQLPQTTVVTPWLAFIAMPGFSISAVSSWVCTSMKPGATIRPAASNSLSPRNVPGSPTAAMRSLLIATSALRRGAPVPSMTTPLRRMRS